MMQISATPMLDDILKLYGISLAESNVTPFGNGLINHTWVVNSGSDKFILQRVNQKVFTQPQQIDQNLSKLKCYLSAHYPDYLFVGPLDSLDHSSLVSTPGGYYRLFPFIKGSHSLHVLADQTEAYEAAVQFGKFSRLLHHFDVRQLHVTLTDFHNLSSRYQEFLAACAHAGTERKHHSVNSILYLKSQIRIVQIFENIVNRSEIPQRVIHHDTKISNVLFGPDGKGLCVIDLDTVMPGYFISDVGDMMRTYLSAAGEEETDLDKITVRPDFFKAVFMGYLQEMGEVLTATEKSYFIYAGQFMIFMQAIRFLTDYLENDRYYGQKYEGHNLNRALNQITLLQRYNEAEPAFRKVFSGIF